MIRDAFAMAGGGGGGQGPANPIVSFFPFLLIILIFYFLLIRPQMKKQKEHQKMIGSVKRGDRVITSGGIHGTVTNVKDDVFVIRISKETEVEVSKSAVAGLKERGVGES